MRSAISFETETYLIGDRGFVDNQERSRLRPRYIDSAITSPN
ncbi:MAG: hypothetical protein VKL42_01375 [Snowella sp.]|nr:hypothetical protein [Snowella sp.]